MVTPHTEDMEHWDTALYYLPLSRSHYGLQNVSQDGLYASHCNPVGHTEKNK